jgi:FKBP-type peptidyl-prolyl cis-trans isomerase 2
MNRRIGILALLYVILAALPGGLLACKSGAAKPPAGLPEIADGMKVTMDITVTLSDKTVAISTAGKEPFTYMHGRHDIWPSLEIALAGMKPGEKKKVSLTSDQAYGPYDESKRQTVKLAQLPPGTKVGAQVKNQKGEIARVIKISEDSAVVDFNNPLAGKDLIIEATILKVEKP